MLPKPHALEYTIFGKFRMQAGGSSFKVLVCIVWAPG